MPKKVPTTAKLHSFHMLVNSCLKSFKLGFNITWTENFQMYKLDLEKGAMNQMSTCQHSLDHRQSKGIPESIYFCFIDYGQAFDYVDPTNWKILKEMGIPDDCTCLLWKPVCRSRSDSYNWTWNFNRFKFGKGVMSRLYIVTCLFNLHAKYIMINAWLDEAQAGIKIGGRNSNNLKYTNNTTLMAESKEELKSLLMRMKEENERACLKLNI